MSSLNGQLFAAIGSDSVDEVVVLLKKGIKSESQTLSHYLQHRRNLHWV